MTFERNYITVLSSCALTEKEDWPITTWVSNYFSMNEI